MLLLVLLLLLLQFPLSSFEADINRASEEQDFLKSPPVLLGWATGGNRGAGAAA